MLGETGQIVEPPPSVLNGFVKRSDGSASLWVDGNVRWNAQSKSAAGLVPSDVGGPAAYLKVISADAAVAPKKPAARGKIPVKPSSLAAPIQKQRLFPK